MTSAQRKTPLRKAGFLLKRVERLRWAWAFAGLETWTAAGLGTQHLLDVVPGGVASTGRVDAVGERLAFDDQLDFLRIEDFAFEQRFRHGVHDVGAGLEDALGLVVAFLDQAADFAVDLDCRVFRVVAVLADLAAEEDLLFFL